MFFVVVLCFLTVYGFESICHGLYRKCPCSALPPSRSQLGDQLHLVRPLGPVVSAIIIFSMIIGQIYVFYNWREMLKSCKQKQIQYITRLKYQLIIKTQKITFQNGQLQSFFISRQPHKIARLLRNHQRNTRRTTCLDAMQKILQGREASRNSTSFDGRTAPDYHSRKKRAIRFRKKA